jgi:hypothetical protein
MKKEKLFDAIGEIKDEYIIEAKEKKSKNYLFIRWSLVASFMVILFLGIVIFQNYKKTNIKSEPVVYNISANSAIDTSDKRQTIGDADYVFTTKVIDEIKTIYKDPILIENENGNVEVSSPYTVYSIEVIDNIKGNLNKNTSIEIEKEGGLSEDGNVVCLYEDDELLKTDTYYILLGYAQPDGSILISGSNSSIILNVDSKSDIQKSTEFKDYKKALEDEIVRNRDRYKSKYEE